MIKKIILSLLLCCLIVSCGKKGDPIYQNSKKTSVIYSVNTTKT